MDKFRELGYLAGATRFRRISDKLYIDGDKIYDSFGIEFKATWFSVFYSLSISEKPLTVLELGELIGFSHITVKNVVKELEENSLVNIIVNPVDKRSKLISLSSAGWERLPQLQKVWKHFADSLKYLLEEGHPDFLNIINRIDRRLEVTPLNETARNMSLIIPVLILDYKPSLKAAFTSLVGEWLSGMLKGSLEEEDLFTINNPDKAYLLNGGFVFFAFSDNRVVGCVALKRLDEYTFEFAKLIVDKSVRKSGIATKLIERCITRCKENKVKSLWLQTTNALQNAHKLYYKIGFRDQEAPACMQVLKRTEKIMMMELE